MSDKQTNISPTNNSEKKILPKNIKKEPYEMTVKENFEAVEAAMWKKSKFYKSTSDPNYICYD